MGFWFWGVAFLGVEGLFQIWGEVVLACAFSWGPGNRFGAKGSATSRLENALQLVTCFEPHMCITLNGMT